MLSGNSLEVNMFFLMYGHVMSLCIDKAIAWIVCRLFVDILCHNLA